MALLNRVITGGYWGAYYLVFMAGLAFLLSHFRHELQFHEARQVETLFVGAAIYAVATGTALSIAIIVEVTGHMVLLIPRAWNKAKDVGRAEGHAEGHAAGRTEGRTEERDRMRSILFEHARRDPETGALIITLDPDAEERLRNGFG